MSEFILGVEAFKLGFTEKVPMPKENECFLIRICNKIHMKYSIPLVHDKDKSCSCFLINDFEYIP